MTTTIPSREAAWQLICEFNETPRARKHALAVEGVMRYFARKHGEDEGVWGIVGLLHDLDFEKFPQEHCARSQAILEERGWPEPIVRAVVSHGYGICSDISPESLMEKTLYAIDELAGFVSAVALVRPSKSVHDLNAKSVKKKWKEKRFAAGVDRSVIERGAQMLNVELADLIAEVILAMREIAADIGLDGSAPANSD